MSYAILQKTAEPFTLEQLKLACRGVPGFTEMDAPMLSKDAFGIIAKGLEWEAASAFVSSLEAQGVEAEAVDEADLPQLPPNRQVHRMDCLPEALMLYDPVGRSFPLEWKNVMMIAAGRVKMSDFNTVMMNLPKQVGREIMMVPQPMTKEERVEHLLLEIIITRGVLRYTVCADKPGGFFFQYLGDRRVRDLTVNFNMVVQDLVKYAPEAILNCGATRIRDTPDQRFAYPSKTAFYQEITWMLWQIQRQH